uniref:Wsv269-like protein n=1 Tax=Metopaulias depressus WSSV-like virus TaxID=1675544 RepID=A0A0K0VLM6_9VIRU|nr:wsv269-like protein [Metopaulias depressus WSSV-like virus]
MLSHTNDDITVRDVKFYTFAEAVAKRAKWIRNKISGTASASINVEFGYGGARLMDVRWTGFKSIAKLCECLYYCGSDLKLRVVGSSAGNIIAYSLAMILAMKGKCCGYNVKNPQRRGTNINKRLFYEASGLNIPANINCVCECVRIIFDLLLEMVAVQEHPAWHDDNDDDDDDDDDDGQEEDKEENTFGEEHTGFKFSTRRKLPVDTIRDMFAGTKTAESVLSFSQGTAASGFSDLFVEAPVQYVLNMYRAIDGLEGRVGVLYTLSRFLVLFCIEWPNEQVYNPFFDVCEIYIGSRKIVDDEGFVFTDLVGTDSVPLVHLSPTAVLNDVERFNGSVDILMDSIDVREIVLPRIAQIIWQRMIKRLKLRNDKSLSDLRNWRWNGKVSTPRSFPREDYELTERQQSSADIMTNNDKDYLPDFEKTVTGGSNDLLCWNYVFELSPMGKHLFQLERVSGLFEASLPLITPWQLKVVQKRRGTE